MKRTLLLLSVTLLASCHAPTRGDKAPAGATVPLRLIALNDFHGYLDPSPFRVDGSVHRGDAKEQPAGGAAALAHTANRLREGRAHTLMVAAGDLIGATPLSSGLLRDEPAIEVMNRVGLAATAVGNHEFDHGQAELARLTRGGCAPPGCEPGQRPFEGARFQYLAANVFERDSGKRAFPPYRIETIDGVKVALVGAVLEGAPEIVLAENIAGLEFRDEADSINALMPELTRAGVKAIVVLIHEGGIPASDLQFEGCQGLSGPILGISDRLDPEIDVVISGHTHRDYLCRYQGRLLTSANCYGHMLTTIDLTLARADGQVLASSAENHRVDPKNGEDPQMLDLVRDAKARTAVIAGRPIAKLAVPQIRRSRDPAGDSPMGRLAADAQLEQAAGLGAEIAFMNPGGIRQHLPVNPRADSSVTFGDLHSVHPFGNKTTVLAATGAQIRALLEQQWQKAAPEGALSVSHGFQYRIDPKGPVGARVVRDSVRLNGQPIDDVRTYRIAVNNFLAAGGDSYPLLVSLPRIGEVGGDIEALEAYLRKHEPVSAPTDMRIEGRFDPAP